MNQCANSSLTDPRIALSRLPSAAYKTVCETDDDLDLALSQICKALGWSTDSRNLLGQVIPEGARVLIKPNFVLHENEGADGMEPMITHPSLIRVVVEIVRQTQAAEILVGDAPVQRCDFAELLRVTGLNQWADELIKVEPRFKGIKDFRRTTCVMQDGVRFADENKIAVDEFVLFDLGSESLLEPVSNPDNHFRVTCYDPRLMAKTHAPGRHQYLVARDVMEADVVINLPKLKTHKKAGITCALKNLIGINGNKEYLPHHRVGGSQNSGDCYPGADVTKRLLEYTLDRQNMAASEATTKIWNGVAKNLTRVLQLTGDKIGVEGSWSGNDTIWRTCLDLNRILLYGDVSGRLADEPMRKVLHIADAIVAGQGDGPLAPKSLPLAMIFASSNGAAMDFVGAQLLGYDPQRLPVVREAFGIFPWPVVSFTQDAVNLLIDGEAVKPEAICQLNPLIESIIYPSGWRDAALFKPPGG
ncbi:MAG: DUF362 domain-containing protein [Acidobacteriota bacterium]